MSTPHGIDADRLARVTLSRTIEPGDIRVTGLVSELGADKVLGYLEAAADVESHWGFALAQELGRVDPAEVLEQAAAQGIRFIVPGDAEWPAELGALRNAGALHERGGEPVGLWVRGAHDLRQLAGNSVAVVGSRSATSYGTEQATELSRDLASMGHTVISGLAYGVDYAAHRGALIAGGPTIAVLPGGVDRPYPVAHAQMLEAIAERGLVVSEAPPGAGPTRTRFLARNRVVAGLGEGTVVVEGAMRSGALNTAQWTTKSAPNPDGSPRPGQQRRLHRRQPADPPRPGQRRHQRPRRHHRRHDPRSQEGRPRAPRRVLRPGPRALPTAGGSWPGSRGFRAPPMTRQTLWITRSAPDSAHTLLKPIRRNR